MVNFNDRYDSAAFNGCITALMLNLNPAITTLSFAAIYLLDDLVMRRIADKEWQAPLRYLYSAFVVSTIFLGGSVAAAGAINALAITVIATAAVNFIPNEYHKFIHITSASLTYACLFGINPALFVSYAVISRVFQKALEPQLKAGITKCNQYFSFHPVYKPAINTIFNCYVGGAFAAVTLHCAGAFAMTYIALRVATAALVVIAGEAEKRQKAAI